MTLGDTQMSSWAYSLRSYDFQSESDYSDDGEDNNSTKPISEDARLMNDLDLSSRPEEKVNYKPNPWNIAKINAACRSNQAASAQLSSRKRASDSHVVSPKRRPSAILDAFKKQASRQPSQPGSTVLKPTGLVQAREKVAPSAPLAPCGTNLLESSRTNSFTPHTLLLPHHQVIPAIWNTSPLNSAQNDGSGIILESTSASAHTSDRGDKDNAHIPTTSTGTCSRTLVTADIGKKRFPQSFSSPIRAHQATQNFCPRAQATMVSNSSPPRSSHAVSSGSFGSGRLYHSRGNFGRLNCRTFLPQTRAPIRPTGFSSPLLILARDASLSSTEHQLQDDHSLLEGMPFFLQKVFYQILSDLHRQQEYTPSDYPQALGYAPTSTGTHTNHPADCAESPGNLHTDLSFDRLNSPKIMNEYPSHSQADFKTQPPVWLSKAIQASSTDSLTAEIQTPSSTPGRNRSMPSSEFKIPALPSSLILGAKDINNGLPFPRRLNIGRKDHFPASSHMPRTRSPCKRSKSICYLSRNPCPTDKSLSQSQSTPGCICLSCSPGL
jgi:hypothetical protein